MIEILVDKKLVKKCQQRAKEIAAYYKNAGLSTRLYSKGAVGQKENYRLHTYGTIAEVALCLYLGIDPHQQFNRETGKSDEGYDMIVGGHTIDVKASDNQFASRLMWPVKKIDALKTAADVFVMSRVTANKETEEGQIVQLLGWITRDEFIGQHHVARGMNGIVDGTPYMNEKSLYSMEQIVQHLGHDQATEAAL